VEIGKKRSGYQTPIWVIRWREMSRHFSARSAKALAVGQAYEERAITCPKPEVPAFVMLASNNDLNNVPEE
jgi:hypothetical protein